LKLLLDEMDPPALAEALRADGIEAATVAERGLAGRSDPDVFAAGAAEGYVVVTATEPLPRPALNQRAAGKGSRRLSCCLATGSCGDPVA
jgi:hypothetical protein